jgi:cyclophilin family peptidyl-prolyl cis-trans isomerase
MNAAQSLAAVNNFVFLARYRYYDGVIFQRVIPGFAVQGGDPTGTGSGGPGYEFTGNTPAKSCEAKSDCYPIGSVAMANTGSPTTNGSQFFIVVGKSGEGLPPNYTLFGNVISGMNVVQKIASEGNSNPQANGMPPKKTYYMMSVTISQYK